MNISISYQALKSYQIMCAMLTGKSPYQEDKTSDILH